MGLCTLVLTLIILEKLIIVFNRSSFDVEKVSRSSNKQLVCTHTVRGHSSGVLSVTASDILLFSGSQGIFTYVHVYTVFDFHSIIICF